jgi:hypothetical protein
MPLIDPNFAGIDVNDPTLGVGTSLTPLDSDRDGLVTADDLRNPVALHLPGNTDTFLVTTADDLAVYAALLESTANARFQTGLFDSEKPFPGDAATTWIAENHSELVRTSPVQQDTDFGIEVLAVRETATGFSLLCKDEFLNDGYGGYFFTLEIADNPELMKIEINGQVLELNATPHDADTAEWRAELLKGLFGLFTRTIPELSAPVQNASRDRMEALMLRADTAPPTPVDAKGNANAALTRRISTIKEGQSPLVATHSVTIFGQKRSLKFHAETGLTEDEKSVLAAAMRDVPSCLWETLDKNKKLATLKFELVAEDIPPAWSPANWGGLYEPSLNMILIPRNYLTDEYRTILPKIFSHELTHRLLFPLDADSFLAGYFTEVKNSVPNCLVNPAVSPYALVSADEFISECVVAYFNGETDASPFTGRFKGPRSRAELREKNPEIYLALRLFFESESPYFADRSVFHKPMLVRLKTLLASANAAQCLNPAAKPSDIAKALGG